MHFASCFLELKSRIHADAGNTKRDGGSRPCIGNLLRARRGRRELAFPPMLTTFLLTAVSVAVLDCNISYALELRSCLSIRSPASRFSWTGTQPRGPLPIGTAFRPRHQPFAPLRVTADGGDGDVLTSADSSTPSFYSEGALDDLLDKFALPLEYKDRDGNSAIKGNISPPAKSSTDVAALQNVKPDAISEKAGQVARSPSGDRATASATDDTVTSSAANDAGPDAIAENIRRRFSDFGVASEFPDPAPSPTPLVGKVKTTEGFTALENMRSAPSSPLPTASESPAAVPTSTKAQSSVLSKDIKPLPSDNVAEPAQSHSGAAATFVTVPSTGTESGIFSSFKAKLEGGLPQVNLGVIGGVLIVLTLYLSLAGFLKNAMSDEGYAGWDDLRPGASVEEEESAVSLEVDDAMEETAYAMPEVEEEEIALDLYNTLDFDSTVEMKMQPAQVVAELESLKASVAGLSKVEDASIMFQPEDESSSLAYLIGIDEFCETGEIVSECSESITGYLDSLSTYGLVSSPGAKTTIISYLDSLSDGEPADMAYSSSSKTGAAFSSYLDALSSGTVPVAPSAKDVADYLGVLNTMESSSDGGGTAAILGDDDLPTDLQPVSVDYTPNVEGRISDVEMRLSKLEDSVASLPDDIASRLMQWQTQQDQKLSDEMKKITAYLVEVKSESTQGR